jgi:cation:H+ antiporter
MLVEVLLLLTGLVVLYFGAESLVGGAQQIAMALGMSPLLVGLTVVAMATSAPELVVALTAASGGSPEIAIGNVVGSNIANIALILGVCALLQPLAVNPSVVRFDLPVMLALTVFAWVFSHTGHEIVGWEGATILSFFVLYLVSSIVVAVRGSRSLRRTSRGTTVEPAAKDTVTSDGLPTDPVADAIETGIVGPVAGSGAETGLDWMGSIGAIILGLTGLIVGADMMVDNAVSLARAIGVSEHVIGVTIVAIGTSLPELATGIVSARRSEADITVGNVVGSNLANIGLILGIVALLAPIPVLPQVVYLDWPLALLCPAILFLAVRPRMIIGRISGGVLLACYATYVIVTAAGLASPG